MVGITYNVKDLKWLLLLHRCRILFLFQDKINSQKIDIVMIYICMAGTKNQDAQSKIRSLQF